MKSRLPIILFVVGIVLVVGIFLFVKSRQQSVEVNNETEEVGVEIPLEKRPFVSLTPKSDGHWLTLRITNIKVEGAATLDYLLEYTADSGLQGVPGEVKLEGGDIERELLLGSESSGKFRYDVGVKKGTLTLRFRSEKGKLVGKPSTDFGLLSSAQTLSTVDEGFKFSLEKSQKAYFVVMETFGLPKEGVTPMAGPYGIFASDSTKYTGTVESGGTYMHWNGSSWSEVSGKTSIGVFVKTS